MRAPKLYLRTYELKIGGERKLTWKRVRVTSPRGFVEIPFEYDAAQLYADGKLTADDFRYGKTWRVPAKLIYGRDCCIVMSELKDDFYREI